MLNNEALVLLYVNNETLVLLYVKQ